MTINQSKILNLIETQIEKIKDSRVVAQIRELQVLPYEVLRPWNYGEPDQMFSCWSVLEHPKSNSGIAYCEFGFGRRSPWGLVTLSGAPELLSIGMDCSWFESFEEAYFESMAATELLIWRVFMQESECYPGNPITPEGAWDFTWKEVYRLRALDPSGRYHCSQSIQIQRE